MPEFSLESLVSTSQISDRVYREVKADHLPISA